MPTDPITEQMITAALRRLPRERWPQVPSHDRPVRGLSLRRASMAMHVGRVTISRQSPWQLGVQPAPRCKRPLVYRVPTDRGTLLDHPQSGSNRATQRNLRRGDYQCAGEAL
jgi:hypothetical protein